MVIDFGIEIAIEIGRVFLFLSLSLSLSPQKLRYSR